MAKRKTSSKFSFLGIICGVLSLMVFWPLGTIVASLPVPFLGLVTAIVVLYVAYTHYKSASVKLALMLFVALLLIHWVISPMLASFLKIIA